MLNSALSTSFVIPTSKMAAKAPKPWKLTEEESFASFKSWQHNISYYLSTDGNFECFLKPNVTWLKASTTTPLRGFTSDRGENGKTAEEKVQCLEHMLGLITQWVPHYLANDIITNSTSMESIWQFIRKYYGFQQSEAHFMKFSSIKWEEGERPQRLYQRLLAHLQDNLLSSGSSLVHNGVTPERNEEMSPTVERLAVLRWMELLHPSLPALVQRTFAHDLQRMSLKDLQPQIADALDGFMEELRQDDVRASRVFAPAFAQHRSRPRNSMQENKGYNRFPASEQGRHKQVHHQRTSLPRVQTSQRDFVAKKSCRVCKAEGRAFAGHDYFTCDYVSQAEKRSSANAHHVDVMDDCDLQYEMSIPEEEQSPE